MPGTVAKVFVECLMNCLPPPASLLALLEGSLKVSDNLRYGVYVTSASDLPL